MAYDTDLRHDALAASIRAALIRTGRDVPADDQLAVAVALISAGSLDQACMSAVTTNHPASLVLLDYDAALKEIDDPRIWVRRLRREEASLRADADYHLSLGAEFDGKAIYQRERGEEAQAVQFERRAAANHALSAEKLAAAAAKSNEADDLSARIARTAELAMVVVAPVSAQASTQSRAA